MKIKIPYFLRFCNIPKEISDENKVPSLILIKCGMRNSVIMLDFLIPQGIQQISPTWQQQTLVLQSKAERIKY